MFGNVIQNVRTGKAIPHQKLVALKEWLSFQTLVYNEWIDYSIAIEEKESALERIKAFKEEHAQRIQETQKILREAGYIFPKGMYLKLPQWMKGRLNMEEQDEFETAQENPDLLLICMYLMGVGDTEVFESNRDFLEVLKRKSYYEAASYLEREYVYRLTTEELVDMLA